MRLLIISDIHSRSEKAQRLSEIIKDDSMDALVICGDITHFGDLAEASTVLSEFAKLGTTIFFVPGNCDPPKLASEPIVEGATNLHGKCLNILGINFIGVGGSVPAPFRTPFELAEDEIERILNAARRDCGENQSTILVSHDPPFDMEADMAFIGHHVGSKAVRGFIEKSGPLLVACGHIHESRAVESLGATTIVNPGPFHRGYYALAEIGEKVTVKLSAL